jgi:hypothetical protein
MQSLQAMFPNTQAPNPVATHDTPPEEHWISQGHDEDMSYSTVNYYEKLHMARMFYGIRPAVKWYAGSHTIEHLGTWDMLVPRE